MKPRRDCPILIARRLSHTLSCGAWNFRAFDGAIQYCEIMSSTYTIVIPTRNRRERLIEALRSVARLQPRELVAGVVVVDDGSTDGTREALAELDLGLPLQVIGNPSRGAAAARNAGVEAATSELILFMDDDCVAAPDLLVQHHRLRTAHERPVAIRGRIDWPPDRPVTWFMRFIDQCYQFGTVALVGRTELAGPELISANLSLPRQLLVDVGGFDEDFVVGFEDAELGIRLAEAGVPLLYAEQAVVWHYHSPTLAAFAARQERFGESAVIFAHKRPDYPDVVRLSRLPRAGTLRGLAKALTVNIVTLPLLAAMGKLCEALRLYRAAALMYSQVLSYHYYRGVRRALRRRQTTTEQARVAGSM